MTWIKKSLTTEDKLAILSQDSQYDLACACGVTDEDRRRRSKEGSWIYPVALPYRRKTYLFKTLISNVCINNCSYCPLRVNRDPRRCTLSNEEITNSFFDYYRKGKVQGIFLSSGVIDTPDKTMDRINTIAALLRKKQFKGYMHLKVIPGASDEALKQAVQLASAVSLNIETAGDQHFKELSTSKNYQKDIIRPLKLLSYLTRQGSRYEHVKQTTQFVVGASTETDREIVNYSYGLYKRLHLNRVYFSAYQKGLGDVTLPGEKTIENSNHILTREHRLYQADWLLRKYGFQAHEIPFDTSGQLSLDADPKEVWAQNHPEFFPVNINTAAQYELLRVPGLGLTSVLFILAARKTHQFRRLEELGRPGKRLKKASTYIRFD